MQGLAAWTRKELPLARLLYESTLQAAGSDTVGYNVLSIIHRFCKKNITMTFKANLQHWWTFAGGAVQSSEVPQ